MYRLLVAIMFLFAVSKAVGQRMSTPEYIEKYKQIAIEEMIRTRVPASITLAQGILESESGNSVLAQKSNNHFGIKCKSDWTGPSVSHDDDKKGECFRVYESVEESFRDHSDFLRSREWYQPLFNLDITDYEGWAVGLKKAGYATNPQYATRLIDIIQKYDLNQFTIAGLIHTPGMDGSFASHKVMEPQHVLPAISEEGENGWYVFRVNGVKAISASAQTSLLAIATHFDIRLKKLLEYNDLTKDGLLDKAQNIFLEKKKPEGDRNVLITERVQTLYDISQEEGVQLASLLNWNKNYVHENIAIGIRVLLRPQTGEEASGTRARADVGDTSGQTAYHEVEAKEGLFAISKKYGVTISQIKEWNNLTGDKLQVGQKLIIYK
ncbi:MAG: glucosaminidase domain-containing protein [Chitinophagaceae bacterium]|nr:glucosaminidase domain-containing protein [Chitinophagaceae bacterium]MCZ2395550.1 glucosaminidase domain-containing protein [Chitinophagales bacterium]